MWDLKGGHGRVGGEEQRVVVSRGASSLAPALAEPRTRRPPLAGTPGGAPLVTKLEVDEHQGDTVTTS